MGLYDELKDQIEKATGADGSQDEHKETTPGAQGGAAGNDGKSKRTFVYSEEWTKQFGEPKGPPKPLTIHGAE